MDEPRIDEEFKSLLPALEPDEYNKLTESIVRDGCRDSVLTWRGLIVDGMNRAEICWAESIPFKTREMEFESRDHAMAWMIDNQDGRRNRTASQRAMMAARRATLKIGRPAKNVPGTFLTPTIDMTAKSKRVSPSAVDQAKSVIRHGVPELAKAVTDGKMSTKAAARLAKRPKEEQSEIMSRGDVAAKEKAKEPPPDDLEKWPEPIRHVFAEVGIFDDLLNHLTQITKLYNQITGGIPDKGGKPMACGVAVSYKYQEGMEYIKKLRFFISSRQPTDICVHCRARQPKMKTCKACRGAGWSTQHQWHSATDNMKNNPLWNKNAAQIAGGK